jgi:tetratricopeptide (TPR) repeat protein
MREGLAHRRELGDRSGVAASLNGLAVVALDRGREDDAIALLEEALVIDRRIGDAAGEAVTLVNLGAARIRAGQLAEGTDDVRRALVVFAALEDADGVAEAVAALGEGCLARGDAARGAALLLVSQAIRQREMMPLRAIEQERFASLLEAALAQVPEQAGQLRAEAAAMDPEGAVSFALGMELTAEA